MSEALPEPRSPERVDPRPRPTDGAAPLPVRQAPGVETVGGPPPPARVVTDSGSDGRGRRPPPPAAGGRSAPEAASPAATQPAAAPVPEPEPRRFRAADAEWLARVAGRGTAGRGPAQAAPLLLVIFSSAERPDAPEREALTTARELDDLSDASLEELFGRARPFRIVEAQERWEGERDPEGDR